MKGQFPVISLCKIKRFIEQVLMVVKNCNAHREGFYPQLLALLNACAPSTSPVTDKVHLISSSTFLFSFCKILSEKTSNMQSETMVA